MIRPLFFRFLGMRAVKIVVLGIIDASLIVGISVHAQQLEQPKKLMPAKTAMPATNSQASQTAAPVTKKATPSPSPSVTDTKPPVVSTAVVPPKTKPSSVPIHKTVPVVTPSPTSKVSSLKPSTSSPSSSSGGTTSTPSTTPPASPPPSTTSYTSTNWSGYMASDGSFTAISGSWTVPNASGVAGETTADATWIGIGGVTTSDLIQTGTQNTVNANGTQTSSGFYELLPGDSITVPNFIVSAGDVITANLTELAPSEWTITLSDTTTDITFTKTVTYDSSLSSAEWIEEDPSYSSYRQVPFDDFGTVNITSAATTENGTSLTMGASDAQEITMVDRDDLPVATPSAMGSDGESFSVTRNEGGA